MAGGSFSRFRVLPLACLALAGGQGARGQTEAANRVAVIKIQSAVAATRDGQKAMAALEIKIAPTKRELESKQKEIRDLKDNLQRSGNTMSDAAREELTSAIDEKDRSFNRALADREAEFQDLQRQMFSDLNRKMQQIIEKYAARKGYSVVLDVSSPNTPVLYAASGVDITKDIVDLYDQSSPAPAVQKQPGQ